MPFIAISVGLAVGKEMVGAIVYNPITEELFTAQKDQKARLTTNPHRQLGSTVYTMMYVAQGKLASYLGYSGHLIDPTGNEFNLFSRKILCAGTEKYAQNMVAKFEVFDFESELAQDKDVNNNHGTMNSSNNGK
uniref:Uncharacterized protein n=1 Tax=Ditylenchus dipsaci TaxID=166011 RepID=A0A915E395_9BILA